MKPGSGGSIRYPSRQGSKPVVSVVCRSSNPTQGKAVKTKTRTWRVRHLAALVELCRTFPSLLTRHPARLEKRIRAELKKGTRHASV